MKPRSSLFRHLFANVFVVVVIVSIFTIESFAQANPAKAMPAKSAYAAVNGLKLYYEVYGTGKPIVLLHGAFNTIDMAFGALIPQLSSWQPRLMRSRVPLDRLKILPSRLA